MLIEVVKPGSGLLSQYIRHIYFLRSGDRSNRHSYLTFPQLTTPLTLLKNVRSQMDSERRFAYLCQDESAGFHAEVDSVFTKPMHIQYEGVIDEVTIVFEPLGLNQFIEQDLRVVATGTSSRQFNPYGEAFDALLSDVFGTSDRRERLQLIEGFFKKKFVGFCHPVLSEAVRRLTSGSESPSITEIARDLGVSHRTLTRLFQRHLCTTPVVFRKIARFRHSLDIKFRTNPSETLTHIAHHCDYYDQSEFVRQYHELAGESPGKFFRDVSALNNHQIFWRFT
ncbi:MAG TPA: helix-turn-helix domain-containing protein [Pyrinomonadaceae bacterium]|nr:helix-turn-helix domain-containing protein [Pyrinomonadaceae bacterium]